MTPPTVFETLVEEIVSESYTLLSKIRGRWQRELSLSAEESVFAHMLKRARVCFSDIS